MPEYQEKFGGPHKEQFRFTIEDEYDDDSTLISREYGIDLEGYRFSDFKLYYSLQLYFSNGGGPCHIVSVGDYEDTIESGSAQNGSTSNVAFGEYPLRSILYSLDTVTAFTLPNQINFRTCKNLSTRYWKRI